MSHIDNTTKDWRDSTAPLMRRLAGLVRRVSITVTSGAFWQGVGHLLLDGDKETLPFEVFSGIGFYARPPAGANTDAILAFPGGPENPVAVAMRDEATAKKMAGGLQQDETAAFNTQAGLYITAAGKVEARAFGGTAVALATKADIDSLRTWIAGHVHGSSGPPTGTPPPNASGTSVLRGQ